MIAGSETSIKEAFLRRSAILNLCSLLFLAAFSTSSFGISVMTYNVENLFDSKDDPNKQDEQYLPLSVKKQGNLCAKLEMDWQRRECESLNWDDEIISKKMSQLAKVILSYGNGKGADIVVLQEIENIGILNQLNTKFLKAAGYKTVELLEGPDVRGIDVGVLSRFQKSSPSKLHEVKWEKTIPKPTRPTRSVLEVNLVSPNGESISVFGVHFPSPRHFIEERQDAFDTLERAVYGKKSDLIVAAGDFNITANEDSRMYRYYMSDRWDVSHHKGCPSCLGTNYYKPRGENPRDSWSFLDAIIIHKSSKFSFKASTIDVWNKLDGMRRGIEQRPNRFNKVSGQGFSDHFPIVAEIYRTR